MGYDFDEVIDRRAIPGLTKWSLYGADALALWIADMDFRTPAPILAELAAALEHGILGYEIPAPALFEAIAARLERRYGWRVSPDAIVAMPNVNVGYRIAGEVFARGGGVLVQPPVFHDFIHFPAEFGIVRQDAPLRRTDDGAVIRYALDMAAVEAALDSGGAATRMLILCNPHNPVGHVFTRDELTFVGRLCVARDILLCSDDIHAELILGDAAYAPVASLSPEIAAQSITLIGPGKAFNCSGFACAFAVIPDAVKREAFQRELARLALQYPHAPGHIVARAAYSGACDDWQAALLPYLTANRDLVVDFVRAEMPEVRVTHPAGTYLAWLDCRERLAGSPFDFFLEKARVALSDGAPFGPGGEGHVRLNFATPRAILAEALDRMGRALRAAA